MAYCCNEGVMFLPLIYPDYTMERESLLMEPSVPSPPSVCLFSSSDLQGKCNCVLHQSKYQLHMVAHRNQTVQK